MSDFNELNVGPRWYVVHTYTGYENKVKATIEKAPPEIAADIAENGMVLSGGGGRIYNLDKLITKRTGMEVRVSDNAFEAVALGAGKSLENIEKLKVYAQGGRKR